MPAFEDLKIFSGNAHPQLLKDICAYLGVSPTEVEVFKFSNDNTFVKILENIREKDVFLIQTIAAPVNDHLMELWIMIDAAKRAPPTLRRFALARPEPHEWTWDARRRRGARLLRASVSRR